MSRMPFQRVPGLPTKNGDFNLVVEEHAQEDSWLIQVEKEMNVEGTDRTVPSCILSVPETLLNDNPVVYIPQIVSLGPYHFRGPQLSALERYKSEAARRIQSRMTDNNFNRIVEEIVSMEQEIKSFYDKKIPYTGKVLGWMMARDASFLLEFLRFFAGNEERHSDSPHCQLIFNVTEGPEMLGVLQDVVKLENQIPLFILEKVLAVELGCQHKAKAVLEELLKYFCHRWTFFRPNTSPSCPAHLMSSHIMQIFHHNIVSNNGEVDRQNDSEPGEYIVGDGKLPHAVELNKIGVKFKAFVGGVQGIRFEKKSSTLFLPVIYLGEYTEASVRNLIAFECCTSSCKAGAISSYVYMMNSLIDDGMDVALLRENEIIVCRLGSDKRAAELFNSMGHLTWAPPYGPIDLATKGLLDYRKRKLKILLHKIREANCSKPCLHEFWEANCSKPWFVISGLAAAALIVMTLLQVICLFTTCNPK